MPRENYNELIAFVCVAREKNFTRAASQLGVSQSALSHSIKSLEARLGARLLTRTTRSVSPTDAGDKLMEVVAPEIEEIMAEVTSLKEFAGSPSGSIRITTAEHAANSIVWPKVSALLKENPGINLELSIDYGLANIVEDRFDAGIRLGHQVSKGMDAVRISPDIRMAVVGVPAYFRSNRAPAVPQDLTAHNCINLRFPTSTGLYAWEFERDGAEQSIRVSGQVVVNTLEQARAAMTQGMGLAFLPEDSVLSELQSGTLIQVLEEWSPSFPGYHLYFPSNRYPSIAMSMLVAALKEDSAAG